MLWFSIVHLHFNGKLPTWQPPSWGFPCAHALTPWILWSQRCPALGMPPVTGHPSTGVTSKLPCTYLCGPGSLVCCFWATWGKGELGHSLQGAPQGSLPESCQILSMIKAEGILTTFLPLAILSHAIVYTFEKQNRSPLKLTFPRQGKTKCTICLN